MQMFIWPCSQTMTYSLPVNHFRSLTSCTDNMTAAIKNEIQTLSVLLRGLCLKKSCTGVINLRCRNVSTACLKHNIKFVPPVKAVSAFASASPFQRNVVCTGRSWAWAWSWLNPLTLSVTGPLVAYIRPTGRNGESTNYPSWNQC